jgi:hypothetical protein
MTLSVRTTDFKPGDGRLKILWIDDRYHELVPGPAGLEEEMKWFSLVCASGPDDVKALMSKAEEDARAGRHHRPEYELTGLPFDIYLTDFRLCDKKNGGCDAETHLVKGLHAPSAGFLLGLLTTLRWPEHPQGVIPYSAYDEEFGQIWRLCAPVCPPSVNVLWDERVTKGNREKFELLRLVAPRYRSALYDGLRAEVIQMPFGERDRWESIVADADSVSAQEKAWFVGEYGLRPFLIGALFYDQLDKKNNCVPTTVVREWLSEIPLNDPLEREARRLADFFWELRSSDYSRNVYAFIREFKAGRERPPQLAEKPASFRWLLDFKHSHETSICRKMRLAVLFLLLREHATRLQRPWWHLSPDAERVLEGIGRLRQESPRPVEEVFAAFRDRAEEIGCEDEVDQVLAEIKIFYADALQDPIAVLTEQPNMSLSEYDVVRLVDPLPSGWDITLSLDKGKKVGKGLSRLKLSDDAPEFDVKKLLEGNASLLSRAERLAAQRYARELLPSSTNWPAWLSGGD